MGKLDQILWKHGTDRQHVSGIEHVYISAVLRIVRCFLLYPDIY